ncbi:MAG: 50S ribosomal protein L6 [Bacilli bacterium]
MSRIGLKKIILPKGVTVTISKDNEVTVKGPKGENSFKFTPQMEITCTDGVVAVARPNDLLQNKALHGTTRAVINNMVVGVSEGFEKSLLIEGVGYRFSLKGKILVVAAGFSHLVELPLPEKINVEVVSPTEIKITGIDRQEVGEFAANVRKIRKPEPYKGKGIRYSDEIIRRKEGKTAK